MTMYSLQKLTNLGQIGLYKKTILTIHYVDGMHPHNDTLKLQKHCYKT